MMSIRKRLLISLLGLWIVIWGAITLVAVERSHHEVEELLDAQLAQTARVLDSIATAGQLSDLGSDPQRLSPIGHAYETKISLQLWDRGELASTFGAAPSVRLAEQPGFSDQEIDGTHWRVFGLPSAEPEEILFVAQDYSIRNELVEYLTLHALQPILWSLPLAVLLIWLAVSDGLGPLARLANDVAERSERRLERFNEADLPAEIRPLSHALNGLMERLRQALSVERRFAADASHELRTPLSIIRTHTQIARRATDPREIAEALDNVSRGVDRATRFVDQLLALSRLCYEAAKRETDSSSLVEGVSGVIDDRLREAAAKSISLSAQLPTGDSCLVGLSASMLDMLVGNLVDNAIKFSPPGGRVSVAIEVLDDGPVLSVGDEGPGIRAEDRERVFERFHRGADPEQSGAGLGLSIVKRICDLTGASIMLADNVPADSQHQGPGLRVEVAFQRAASAATAAPDHHSS